MIQNRLNRISDKGIEKIRAAQAVKSVPKHFENVSQEILERPSAQYAVKRENNKRSKNADGAVKCKTLVQRGIRADRPTLRHPAERELRHHDDAAHNKDQNQINQQECKTPVFPKLIRECPKIPQPDSRADRRHQKTEMAGPLAAAFLFAVIGHNVPPPNHYA